MQSKVKRVLEIELIKVIAIVGMVFVHIYELTVFAFNEKGGASYYAGVTISFFGGIISGGAFMFAMGWGAAFSDKATPKTYLDRFLQLNLLGLLVNVFEQWLPMLIMPGKFGNLKDQWYSIFAVDIYAFASLAMLYLAFLKKISDRKTVKIIVSAILLAAVLLVNSFIRPEHFSTGYGWADTIIGLFVRENKYSYFPFVSWIAFPITGFIFGTLYRKWDDKKKFNIFLAVSGTVVIAVGSIIMKLKGISNAVLDPYDVSELEYYALDSINVACGCGFIAVEFVIASAILRLTGNKLPNLLLEMSKNVLHIYIAQWLMIGLLVGVINKLPNVWTSMLLSAAVLSVAFGYSVLRNKLVERSKNADKLNRYIIR